MKTRPDRPGRRKRLLRRLVVALAVGAVGVVAVEGCYRSPYFDFYAPELEAYNPTETLERAAHSDRAGQTILCLGDSFTAGRASYPSLLAERLGPDRPVVNSGVSGTGIFQARLMLEKRLPQFRPGIVVYQVYVGNDLFDLRYPHEVGNLGLPRRTYWFAANHLRFLVLLNHRLAARRGPPAAGRSAASSASEKGFSVDGYNERVRLYLAADPRFLDRQIEPSDHYEKPFERFLELLGGLRRRTQQAGADLVVVFVPHAAQISRHRYDQYLQLGARFEAGPALVGDPSYGFLRKTRERYPDLTIVDPLPRLAAAALDGAHLTLERDPHLTEVGNDFLADEIARALERLP